MRFYYGWTIVGISMVSLAFWYGTRGAFSVFYVTLLDEFQWSRADAAGVQSAVLIVYMVMAPVIGGLIDRFGPRRVIVPGILLLALGLFLSARLENLTQFYVFYGLMAASGAACIGVVAYSAILAHWFEKRRGTASGIAVSGMGLGTFFLVLLSQYVITAWGWRWAFACLGGFVLVMLFPVNLFLLRHRPQDLGLSADGGGVTTTAGQGRWEVMDREWCQTSWTLRRAVGQGRFWALLAFPFFVIVGLYIVTVHHVRFLVDMGMEKTAAAYVMAVLGLVSSAFRVFWGWLSDRIGREITYTLGAAGMCVGICSLLLLESTGERAFVYPFVFFFGMGWGVTAPMFMAAAADLFQGRSFGLIYGVVEGVIGTGAALGTWLAGYWFDQVHTYQGAFGLACATTIVSCGFVWLAAPRKVRRVSLAQLS